MSWISRTANALLIAMVLSLSGSLSALPQPASSVDALNAEVSQLYGQGNYPQATAVAQRALAQAMRSLGPNHSSTLTSLNNLALLFHTQGRYGEAEPLYKRALEAYERQFGPENPSTLICINNLAELYRVQGRFREAEPLYGRSLKTAERALGPEHTVTLQSRISLAVLYQAEGRYREAEPLLKRVINSAKRVFGEDHPNTLKSITNLAALYTAQGRYSEAEPLYKQTLVANERTLGKDHPDTLVDVLSLAILYQSEGRLREAEPLYKRAVEAQERTLGQDNPVTLKSMIGLGSLYETQGRFEDAEPILKRALAGAERVLGKEHPTTLEALRHTAELYRFQNRLADAEPLYRRALQADSRLLGPDNPETLGIDNNLGELYDAAGRFDLSEPLLKRAAEGRERVLGADHPATLQSINTLAGHYAVSGASAEAIALYQRVLAARQRAFGPEADHPEMIATLNDIAVLYMRQRDWPRAVEFWRRSTEGLIARTMRGAETQGQALTGRKKSDAEREVLQFRGLVKADYRAFGVADAKARETFQLAQWALGSEAAKSLAQMAARGANGNPDLAIQVRRRQDLLAEWQSRDAQRDLAIGLPAERRDAKAEAENIARLGAMDAEISAIDRRLAVEYPDYASLASPTPLTVEDVQALLGENEALVLFLDTTEGATTPQETFLWAVTKTGLRWIRSDLGSAALAREVQALRCGLDEAAWTGPRCAEITGKSYTDADRDAGQPPPFDNDRAYKLYQALFGQVEDFLRGKQLLVVPSGPLMQLPFQVLVTASPGTHDQKSIAWLIRDHAITVLPAVSSLKALRRVAHPTAASKPMIGFGNPLLDGPTNAYLDLARLARSNKTCASLPNVQVASVAEPRGLAQVQMRGGFADVSFLRKQVPLPETADELCAVARDVHADTGDIFLGARATEREVKRLSRSGELGKYRIIHFATHGALAGQVKGNAEPGLLLTPPDAPTEEDDGYLTASEIAALKLDADWVILSACNTAAGGAEGAEALSGLARAFIYAQARALLVSHWAVNSDATVKLITGAMTRLAADKFMGRAEAIRRSMLALIDQGELREAHPSIWAPFVAVGEGGAAR